jgi:hypothetical protein
VTGPSPADPSMSLQFMAAIAPCYGPGSPGRLLRTARAGGEKPIAAADGQSAAPKLDRAGRGGKRNSS